MVAQDTREIFSRIVQGHFQMWKNLGQTPCPILCYVMLLYVTLCYCLYAHTKTPYGYFWYIWLYIHIWSYIYMTICQKLLFRSLVLVVDNSSGSTVFSSSLWGGTQLNSAILQGSASKPARFALGLIDSHGLHVVNVLPAFLTSLSVSTYSQIFDFCFTYFTR